MITSLLELLIAAKNLCPIKVFRTKKWGKFCQKSICKKTGVILAVPLRIFVSPLLGLSVRLSQNETIMSVNSWTWRCQPFDQSAAKLRWKYINIHWQTYRFYDNGCAPCSHGENKTTIMGFDTTEINLVEIYLLS